MGVIDKVSLGGTTYDVRDARTDLMHIVEEGYPVTAYGADYSTTSYGVTYTKIGNRLTLNGTNNFGGSADRYYAFGTGSPLFSGTTGWSGVTNAYLNTGFVLKAGVTYKLTMRVLSGSTTSPGTAARLQFYLKNADGTGNMGGSPVMTVGSTFPQEQAWTYTPAADKILGYGLIVYPKIVFSNLVIEFCVQGITENTVTYTASDPTIAASAGVRYICSAAYVTSLSFTPCVTGICSVRFASGTTPTVLTLPDTVKMPDWWNGCEANRTYEISIEDGVYGVVASWA